MKEYIDRAEYRKRLSNLESWCQDLRKPGLTQALQMFEEIPAADVAPVVHGRWIERRVPHAMEGISAKCSVCTKSVQYLGNPLNYCPNCGAKMDGGANDASV